VVARFAAASLPLGDHWVGLLLDAAGPSFAALLSGALIRAAGQRLSGGQKAKALRCAYASLGLSPIGASRYSRPEIECQLEWTLRQARTDALRVWAAYEYIRENQHPALTNPWVAPRGVATDCAETMDVTSACCRLHLDPSSPHSQPDLRRRYLQLALICHPDKPDGDHDTYVELHAAYTFLCEQGKHSA